MTRASLKEVPSKDLERLLRELRRGGLRGPLTRAALSAVQLGHLWDRLAPLAALAAAELGAVLEMILAERGSAAAPRIELVWTGPEGKSAWARPTGAVLKELFQQAQRSVLLAGYSFDHGSEILEPLHAAMKDRGVRVDMYLHVNRAPRAVSDLKQYAENELLTFLRNNWPFGPPHPVLHYDPRTVQHRSIESLHAKCVVVDDRVALIGSANFTDRGQSRNIEAGAVVEDPSFAQALAKQWRSATAAGVFVEWVSAPG